MFLVLAWRGLGSLQSCPSLPVLDIDIELSLRVMCPRTKRVNQQIRPTDSVALPAPTMGQFGGNLGAISRVKEPPFDSLAYRLRLAPVPYSATCDSLYPRGAHLQMPKGSQLRQLGWPGLVHKLRSDHRDLHAMRCDVMRCIAPSSGSHRTTIMG